jgi:hypothetical protein
MVVDIVAGIGDNDVVGAAVVEVVVVEVVVDVVVVDVVVEAGSSNRVIVQG